MLKSNSSLENIFSSDLWQRSWLEAVSGDTRFKPLSLCLNPEKDIFKATFFYKKKRRLHPFCNFLEYPAQEIAYNIDLLKAGNINSALAVELINKLIESSGWDVINIRRLKKTSVYSEIIDFLSKKRAIFRIEEDDSFWNISLPKTFKEYIFLLDNKYRKRFSYYINRTKKSPGYEFFFVDDNIDAYWNNFLRLHKQRVGRKKQNSLLSTPLYENFYRILAKKYAKKGSLKMACLKIENEICAMLFGIEDKDTFYYINSGFADKFAKYSLGITLPLLCIDYAIGKRLKNFNLLGGNDNYKKNLGAVSYPTTRLLVYKNRIVRLLERLSEKMEMILCKRK